jgi:hypothetical protein
MCIGDPEVRAVLVGTSEPLGVDAFGGSPSAFHLRPGTHRCMRRLSSRRGSGGETTGGAVVWGARLEETVERTAHLRCCSRLGRTRMGPPKRTKQEQAEQEEGHEQEEQPMVGHQDPRYLKMGKWKD